MSSPAARGLSICGNTFPDECCRPNRGILSIEVLAAQPPDEWCRPNRGRCVLYPVGTRGGVGWMRGPCACPGGDATGWPHATQTTRQATRTSTRPPPFSTSTPCPYRTQADIPTHSPIRLAKNHQGDCSNGQGLFFTLNLALHSKPRYTTGQAAIM